ncbi:MAG: glycosyltransferase [Deferribacteraceae bacterium]|jgi:glycosyltransferase involved in cell wall biosynthesis|nr:glycosyltransferase [Deferribacteraceae bacterium]
MSYAVVIPVYDRPELVKDAIESVFRQTLPATEIIVVDDASPAVLQGVLEPYLPRIKLIQHMSNRGVSAARNSGVAASSSQFIAFLDSDDLWLPSKMQTQIDFMNSKGLKISHSDEFWYRRDRWVNQGKNQTRYGGWIFDNIVDKCRVSSSSLVVDRDLFNAAGGYDENLQVCEDYALSMRLALLAEIGYIDDKLFIKRDVAENSLSRHIEHIESIRLDILTQLVGSNALTPNQLECANREIARKMVIVKR